MRFIILSTTSKHDKACMKLPNKKIFNEMSSNYLVSTKKYLEDIIQKYNQKGTYFILDSERKQNLSLYDEAKISNKIDYKPNDLTMEAADLTLLEYFDRDITNKSIAIYGTGNIAFKLALRLSERNANVYLYGRNEHKVKVCVEALKQITFDARLVHYGDFNTKVDCLLSFVTANQIIDEKALMILNDRALCLDGGIGNFSKDFIKHALEKGHDVRRLDVRQSQEIMDGYINSRLNSNFKNIIGRDIVKGYSIVAGGIMGQEGEVIVDKIKQPSAVIGIADGIGGVKFESELNYDEKEKIKKVQLFIKQNV